MGRRDLSVPDDATAGDVWALLELGDEPPGIAYAVNRQYAARTQPISDGDEVALIPPVSGGSDSMPRIGVLISAAPIDIAAAHLRANDVSAGAQAAFTGTVRNATNDKAVVRLEYEAYEEMAIEELQRIATQAAADHALLAVEKSGVCHLVAEDEAGCIADARALISFLPQNNVDAPPWAPTDDPADRLCSELDTVIPDNANKPYDMNTVIRSIVDDGAFFEIQPTYARNIVTGFARLNGHSIGIVGNQPAQLAGVLDIASSEKAARFVRTCDAFGLPILTLVDVPGFLPGTEQEWGGIIRHGAKLLYAYGEATVPKLTLITRKAYGGAYDVMGSKHLRADVNLAWPTAEVAVMGPEGAVNVVYRKELAEASDPEARRAELIDEYRARFANPYTAAERGFVDDVITPRESRHALIDALEAALTKRVERPKRKHGNIPL